MIRIIGPGVASEMITELVANQSDILSDLLLVNALSESERIGFDDLSDTVFDKTCVEDVVDCFSGIAEILPSIRDGSRIIFLIPSAFLGDMGCAHQATYAAMLVGLARSLALELAKRRITVNCVAPTLDENFHATKKTVALLRSETCENITGQVFLIDGGENLALRKASVPT